MLVEIVNTRRIAAPDTALSGIPVPEDSAIMNTQSTCDVLIVGAGPVGLTLANLLGQYGVSALVIERNSELIDYPRGVSMDDECLRVFQTIGLVDPIRDHTAPDQWIRYITARGRCFASVEPRTREFGWPRRNAFIQPLVDHVLFRGLSRFHTVAVQFGQELTGFQQDGSGVTATLEDAQGASRTVAAQFVVGCDGGRSTVRKILDIKFEGKTDSTRWVVIDIANDPLGIPDAYLFCDPARPTVSMALPHGIRRFEFMVFEDEKDQDVTSAAGIRKLLALVLPDPDAAEVIRGRVYTHHARLAERFRSGRVLLAGDAAHLMPVWQGQGFNSGIRDASNIAWKLAAVLNGLSDEELLSTYDLERREHASAMIALSVFVGRIFSPTNRLLAKLRDFLSYVLGAIPSVKSYILQMRFKPMPFYSSGAIVHQSPSKKFKVPSPVGRMFAQPWIKTTDGQLLRFDDAIGTGFAIVSWVMDPRHYMDADTREYWDSVGARYVSIIPETELAEVMRTEQDKGHLVLVDVNLDFKDWFGRYQVATVVLRPDRFVAAAVATSEISRATREFKSVCFAVSASSGMQ